MRIILKIIAAPFVVILTIAGAFLSFVFCYAAAALNIVSGIGALLGAVILFAYSVTNGIIILVLAFLISQLGLPAIAEWLLDKLDDLNYSLKDFITS